MGYLLPIIMIVTTNTAYHLCANLMPAHSNPFAALVITYASSTVVALILACISSAGHVSGLFSGINWTSYLLGFVIVFLELGYIQAYRSGWNISVCSLVANITVAIILLAVGILFYKEHLSTNQMIGAALCLVGLLFINKH